MYGRLYLALFAVVRLLSQPYLCSGGFTPPSWFLYRPHSEAVRSPPPLHSPLVTCRSPLSSRSPRGIWFSRLVAGRSSRLSTIPFTKIHGGNIVPETRYPESTFITFSSLLCALCGETLLAGVSPLLPHPPSLLLSLLFSRLVPSCHRSRPNPSSHRRLRLCPQVRRR